MVEKSDPKKLQQMAQAMCLVSTSIDKSIREYAELVLLDLEKYPGQMTRLFDLVLEAMRTRTTESDIVRKSCLAYLTRYVNRQFTLGNDEPKYSRVLLFETMKQYTDRIVRSGLLSEHELDSIRQDFSVMLKAECNYSLTVNFVIDIGSSMARYPEMLNTNCHYLLSVVNSAAKHPQMLVKVYNRCFEALTTYLRKLMDSSQLDPPTSTLVWNVLRVICKLFELMEPSKFQPIWNQLLRNGPLFNLLLQILATNQIKLVSMDIKLLSHALRASNILRIGVAIEVGSEPGVMDSIKIGMLPQIIEFLLKLVNTLVIEGKYDQEYTELMESYFDFFLGSVGISTLSILASRKKDLLFRVLLPCIRPTYALMLSLKEEPEEYLNRRMDLCHEQKSDTLECRAVKILEELCDVVDGTLTFVIYWCVNVLHNCCKPVELDPEYTSSMYFKTTDEATKVEVALIVLTTTSYTHNRRDDLLLKIETAVREALAILCDTSRPNIYVQFCYLFAYNLDRLFYQEPNMIGLLLENLLTNINREGNSPAVVIVACYTIEDLMSYERFMPLFEHHIKAIVYELLKRVCGHYRLRVFMVVAKLFKLYPRQIGEVADTLQHTASVLSRELQQIELNKLIPDKFVLRLLNWVYETLEADRYPAYSETFIGIIMPLFSIYLDCNVYTDRLLKITNICMKRLNCVPNFLLPLVLSAEKLISDADSDLQEQAFITLNHIVTKCSNAEVINALANICLKNLASRVTPKGYTNPLLFVMLIHLVLSMHFATLQPLILEELLQQICSLIRTKYVRRRVEVYRLYLLILMEFMKNNLEDVTNYLKNKNIYEEIFHILYESENVYLGDIPTKIFVLCQLMLLSNPNFDRSYSDNSFKLVISMLRVSCNKIQSQTSRTANLEEGKEDSSSGVGTEDDGDTQEEKFYKLLMTPYRTLDELAYFQQTIRALRSNYVSRAHFDTFYENLPVAQKNFVTESLSLRTLRLQDGTTQIRKVLTVVRGPT